LKEAGIFSREKNTLEIVVYYVIFAVVWIILFTPALYDIVLFVFYAINDFGAAYEILLDDYFSGWTLWACG